MAICRLCEREMLEADSCIQTEDDQVPYGDEHELPLGLADRQRCHDCGVKKGGFHHLNCDMERCAKCGGQRLSCDCDIEDRP